MVVTYDGGFIISKQSRYCLYRKDMTVCLKNLADILFIETVVIRDDGFNKTRDIVLIEMAVTYDGGFKTQSMNCGHYIYRNNRDI